VTTTAASETSSTDRIRELIRMVDGLAKQVKRWQETQNDNNRSAIEALESRVGEIGTELGEVSSRINTYSEMFESTSESSMDAAEIPVLEHLAFRVAHLEKWVAKLDDKFKKDASLARKQFIISLVTLGAAAVFLGIAIWSVLSV
jgi:archaellum component FlaC